MLLCKAAWFDVRSSTEATRPTTTPSISTLASGFITKPARGESTVAGTESVNLPANTTEHKAITPAIDSSVTRPTSGRSSSHTVLAAASEESSSDIAELPLLMRQAPEASRSAFSRTLVRRLITQ